MFWCYPRAPSWSWICRTRLVTRVCWLKTIRLYCCRRHVLPATCRISPRTQKLPANEWLLPTWVRGVSWLATCEFIITSQKADNHLFFFKNQHLFCKKNKKKNVYKSPDVLKQLIGWTLNSELILLLSVLIFLLWFLNKVIFITVPSVKRLCFINMLFYYIFLCESIPGGTSF